MGRFDIPPYCLKAAANAMMETEREAASILLLLPKESRAAEVQQALVTRAYELAAPRLMRPVEVLRWMREQLARGATVEWVLEAPLWKEVEIPRPVVS